MEGMSARAHILSNSLSLPWLIGCLRLQDSPVFNVVGRKGRRESHRQRSRYLCAVRILVLISRRGKEMSSDSEPSDLTEFFPSRTGGSHIGTRGFMFTG